MVKTPAQIAAMRTGGQMLAAVLADVAGRLEPGMATAELDRLAVAEAHRLGGQAAFLGHEGFPKSICISVNEGVVHGIPTSRVLAAGDVVGLDFGIRYDGLVTDAAITVPVGEVGGQARHLLKVTEEALSCGIDQARAGQRVGDVSAAIERCLRAGGLGIVRELAGHGVGRDLWEEPSIPNLGVAGRGPLLKAGMTVAIEPMATLGNAAIRVLDDGWTIVTRDRSLAAQFEHTVVITDGPAEILTAAPPRRV